MPLLLWRKFGFAAYRGRVPFRNVPVILGGSALIILVGLLAWALFFADDHTRMVTEIAYKITVCVVGGAAICAILYLGIKNICLQLRRKKLDLKWDREELESEKARECLSCGTKDHRRDAIYCRRCGGDDITPH